MPTARIYLSPGMFGFAQLAGYAYFGHVEDALRRRFDSAGQRVEVRICEVHPTASIRKRAAKLAQMVAHTAGSDDGPIHLVGHSTGGLDARLVASPSVRLAEDRPRQLGWVGRLRTVTTLSTPHYGTPLATFFATAKGQQLLYALSALTVSSLKLGAPPLAAASALVAAFGRSEPLGIELALVDRIVDPVAQLLDEASSHTFRSWLQQLRDDQGGVVQLMPEAMDLFQAGVEDRPGVRYQCVASYVPRPGLHAWVSLGRSPWAALSAVLFRLLHRITAEEDPRYPCSPPEAIASAVLFGALGEVPAAGACDGIVPLRSQLWGQPLWIGAGDHLDVVGHFGGHGAHHDWMLSGTGFSQVVFDGLMDRLATSMLRDR